MRIWANKTKMEALVKEHALIQGRLKYATFFRIPRSRVYMLCWDGGRARLSVACGCAMLAVELAYGARHAHRIETAELIARGMVEYDYEAKARAYKRERAKGAAV